MYMEGVYLFINAKKNNKLYLIKTLKEIRKYGRNVYK